VLDPAQIFKMSSASVGRIEWKGETHDGTIEQGTGSGFVFGGANFLLTCKHVLPRVADYKNIDLRVRLETKSRKDTIPAKVFWLADNSDAAILTISDSKSRPLPIDNRKPDVGVRLITLGFPVNFNQNITDGLVGPEENAGRYLMSAPVNPGVSGGPVIAADGRVIGIVHGAHLKWRPSGDPAQAEDPLHRPATDGIPLQGLNIFIPLSLIMTELPPDRMAAIGTPSSLPPASPPELPGTIRTAYSIDVTKDDHPVLFGPHTQTYTRTFTAEPGYKISDTNLSPTSQVKLSGLKIDLSPDRKQAIVQFKLTSGPTYDRWRGWLEGTLELTQTRQ
jgi:hypothetical protein